MPLRGKVVVVVGHSDTLGAIAQELGGPAGSCSLSGDEYDNLCLLSLRREGPAQVLQLQYGNASP